MDTLKSIPAAKNQIPPSERDTEPMIPVAKKVAAKEVEMISIIYCGKCGCNRIGVCQEQGH